VGEDQFAEKYEGYAGHYPQDWTSACSKYW